MEPASAAPRSAPSEDGQKGGKGQIRLAAVTPRTPDPKSVGFQQFCDGLRTDLPGDSFGRGSFDTSARFVAGDPGAKFGATAPLEYDTTGEVGHPHWEWPSMMRASSMGTLMNPQLLHGFPAKGLLFGVETISKRREDCAKVRKPGPLDAS